MTNALLIIDVQNDFCEGGSLAVPGGEEVAQKVAGYLGKSLGYDYIATTQDWHINPGAHFSDEPDFIDTWPTHCVAGTWGADLHDSIRSVAGLVVDRHFMKGRHSAAYSGFEGDTAVAYGRLGLREWLLERDVTDVYICGIATDYCVKATALDAVKAGFDTRVLLPLCAAVNPETERAAIDEMRAAGISVIP